MSPDTRVGFLDREFAPHDYQIDCLSALSKTRARGKQKALIVMATGLGKTAVAAFDVLKFFEQREGERVLYLCHQNDILVQARGTFEKILGEENKYGYFHGEKKDFDANILFASLQTMQDWKDRFPRDYFDYVIVDESHHSSAETYLPTINYFNPKFLLAITATPDRSDLLDIRRIFGKEVFSLPLERALAKGYLTSVDYRVMTDKIISNTILEKLQTPAGRMSIAKLNRELFLPRRDEEIARILQERMQEFVDPKVIVFCRNIRHAESIAKVIPDSLVYHSKQGLEQGEVLEHFRKLRSGVIVTVNKFNEGVDIPEANVLVFLRTTSSKILFYQQLGRGLRKVDGKDFVLILDFVGNVKRLELLNNLKNRVQVEVEKTNTIRAEPGMVRPIYVDGGNFSFDEEAVDILDLIKKTRIGYTKETLIQMVKELGVSLGKVPTFSEVEEACKLGLIASPTTFIKYFGSFPEALQAAGYEVPDLATIVVKSTEVMINEIIDLKNEIGHFPSESELSTFFKTGKCASQSAYRRRFGNMNKVREELERRGVEIETNISEHTVVDKQQHNDNVLTDLRKLIEELGHIPTGKELSQASKEGRCITGSSFRRRFGSFEAALGLIGISEGNKRGIQAKYKDVETIEMLRKLTSNLGRLPTTKDIQEAHERGELPDVSTLRQKFGSLKNIQDAIIANKDE